MKEEKKIIPFEIKSEDITEDGIFTGYASTFGGNPDSYGDVIREGAFLNTIKSGGRNGNGIALLWQHNTQEPVGIWLELSENAYGLKVTGKLEITSEQGKRYHNLLKMGAIKGLSIGWDFPRDGKGMIIPGSFEYDREKDVRYLNKLELWEISLVTFPANINANITNVKNLIEKATNERELENALRDECNMSINASKYIVGLCKEKLFSRGKFLTDEDLQKIIDEKVNDELNKKNNEKLLEELKNFNNKINKSVIPFKSYPLVDENTTWDGSAEKTKADVVKLKVMCTWYDSENPDVKSSYKLPHHRADDFHTVWNGVKAAMGALLGARGGTSIPDNDRKSVYNHLVKHYREFDKEPPEFS